MQKSAPPSANDLQNLNWDDLRYFLEVARTQRASGAAKRLGVDYTTVARRVRALEDALGTLLFDKSRSGGFILTAEGQRLLAYADAMETTVQSATEHIANSGHALSGHVRVGCTEGFGCFFLAPQLARFQDLHRQISIDLLPVPHFVSLSKREADIAVTLERPEHGQTVYTKLCDYRLRLYATREYLEQHEPVHRVEDLGTHRFASYIDDLAFSYELLYLDRAIPGAVSNWRSTSVIAQYHAALQGRALAILPCFIAAQDPRLEAVLADEIVVTRAFYLSCREDLRKLKRITAVWDFLRTVAELNHPLLMGEDRTMLWSETARP
jgi:molybdate transport repressor ModE-like protein